jgi:hypothetical protein
MFSHAILPYHSNPGHAFSKSQYGGIDCLPSIGLPVGDGSRNFKSEDSTGCLALLVTIILNLQVDVIQLSA